ncbi:MAG: protein kinase [Planctomycetes bacterium]|nr:protein kinase [Planctomycetota bacterium]
MVQSDAPVPLAPGDRVGNLRLERELGRGGFGAVYLARDELVGRHVALKMVLPSASRSSAEDRESFLREARAIAGIPSPHIVTLYSVHDWQGGGFLIEMEYVDGGSLRDLLVAEGRVTGPRARTIARGVLDALRCAHERGVLHRDVKPDNVLIGRDGTVKLADFGLALVTTGVGNATTTTGGIVGTPWYMAPELFTGAAATSQTDLWAAGVTIHEMLTGSWPFGGDRLPDVIRGIRDAAPPPLPADTDAALARIVAACLSKRPEDRPRSAAQPVALLGESMRREPAHVSEPPPSLLAGRDQEAAILHAALREVAGGGARAFVVRGAEGCGKSALLDEVRRAAPSLGCLVVDCRVTSGHGWIPALADALRRAIAPDGRDETIARRAESDALGVSASFVRTLLGTGSDSSGVDPSDASRILASTLFGLAGGGPVCVVADDLHLLGEADLRLVRGLLRALAGTRGLFVGAARPVEPDVCTTLSEPEPGDETVALAPVAIDLAPLSADAVYRVLQDRSGARIVPAQVADCVAARAGGNPLLALELFRHLSQARAIVARDDAWEVVADPALVQLPTGLRDAFARRVERLDEDDRELLEAAAVAGPAFDGASLAAVVGESSLAVLKRLQRLARRGGTIEASGDGYRFEHPLVRDVLTEQISPPLRRALHAAFAEYLTRHDASDALVLGTHWEQAGDAAKARPLLVAAAADAARRLDRPAALNLVQRAGLLTVPPDADLCRSHGESLVRLAGLLRDANRTNEASALLDAVGAATEGTCDDAFAARLRISSVLTRHQAGNSRESDRDALLQSVATLPESRELAMAHYVLGLLARRAGDHAAAERSTLAADAIFQALGLEQLHGTALNALGAIAELRGDLEGASELWAGAAVISDRVGRPVNAAISRVNRAGAAIAIGRIDGLRPELERAVRVLELARAPGAAAHASGLLSALQHALGDLRAAEETSARATRAAREAGARATLTGLLCGSAGHAAALGRLDDASSRYDEALQLATAADDPSLRAQALAIGAAISAWSGDADGARRLGVEALDGARASGVGVDAVLVPMIATCVAGTSGRFWRTARDHLRVAADLPARTSQVLARALDGAVAFAEGSGDAATLVAAADALAGGAIGDCRAELIVTSHLLRAEGARRSNDLDGAMRAADDASTGAARMEHVWLEIAACRWMERIEPSSLRRERWQMLLRRASAEMQPGVRRDAVVAAWSAG